MTISRAELKDEAKAILKDNWNNAILASLIYLGITITIGVVQVAFSGAGRSSHSMGMTSISNLIQLANLILAGPLVLGFYGYFLDYSNGINKTPSAIFEGFSDFARALAAYLLQAIFILLWMLLLIIPGIIAALSYSQVYFILKEDPQISAMDALRKSKEMMNGYKAEYFVLGLSFIGWILLGMLSFGIGLIWLYPYMVITYANFYKKIKGETVSVESESDIPVVNDIPSAVSPANIGPEL